MSGRGWTVVAIVLALVWSVAVGAGAIHLSGAMLRAAPWPTREPARAAVQLAALKQGREAARARDHERAVAIYTAALDDAKTSKADRRALLRQRAFAYEDLRRYQPAELDLVAALAIEPIDPRAYSDRGFFLLRRERFDEALADFAAGARLDPKRAAFAYGEGRVHSRRKDHAKAIARYDAAIRLAPRNADYYAARASELNSLKRYDEALVDYDTALEIGLGAPRATAMGHLGRGYALLQLKQFERAKADFDRTLKVVPESSNALGWRGYAHHSLGDRERALADYRAALAIAPDNAWVAGQLEVIERK